MFLLKDVKSVILPLVCGIFVGIHFTLYYQDYGVFWMRNHKQSETKIVPGRWDVTLADQLFNEIRVVCWITTGPENHKSKAIHIKNTWGKRCNKLLFMSSELDSDLDTIPLPVNEGRNNLWDKTKSAFQYIYRNHLSDAEWFLKADDDSYIIMENLRYMLQQYDPETSLYMGHRYAAETHPYSYMAGGGYILSKVALTKLVEKLLTNSSSCRQDNDGAEDYEMGRCIGDYAIHVDTRDSLKQQRFFPVGVEEHLQVNYSSDYWYYENNYYPAKHGDECCSRNLIGLHYIEPKSMYKIEYLIYHVSPFGVNKNHNQLPRKLSLEEILEASDKDSVSNSWKPHKIIHRLND